MRHIENWEKALDENFQVGTLLMDLSKAFGSISDVLLIAKLYAYGLSAEATTFFHTNILEKKSKNRRHPNLFDIWSTLRVYSQSDPF